MYFHIFQLIHHELDTKTYRSIAFYQRQKNRSGMARSGSQSNIILS